METNILYTCNSISSSLFLSPPIVHQDATHVKPKDKGQNSRNVPPIFQKDSSDFGESMTMSQ